MDTHFKARISFLKSNNVSTSYQVYRNGTPAGFLDLKSDGAWWFEDISTGCKTCVCTYKNANKAKSVTRELLK